jgi:hypothetical protein
MHTSRLVPAVAVVAALAATSTAGASFTGNVCRLASAKQAAPLTGRPSHCTRSPATKGLGSTIDMGTWAGPTATSPRVQATVALYADSGALQLARRNLKQGLPGGTPRKVSGIGTAAYEAGGASAFAIHFAVGKYVVYLTLTPVGKPRSAAALEALAKTIAVRL